MSIIKRIIDATFHEIKREKVTERSHPSSSPVDIFTKSPPGGLGANKITRAGLLLSGSPVKNVSLLWTFTPKSNIRSTPAIGKNGNIYFGCDDEFLYSIDSRSGKPVWQSKLNSFTCSSPAMGEKGAIYIGDNEGYVYAINEKTGKHRWQYRCGRTITRWRYEKGRAINCAPEIGSDGTVYAASLDRHIYAIKGKSGKEKWIFNTGDPIFGGLVVNREGGLFAGNGGRDFYALDVKKGTAKWRHTTEMYYFNSFSAGFNYSRPAIGSDGTVYVANTERIYAFDPCSGNTLWQFKANGSTRDLNAPVVGPDGTVYSTSGDGHIYAIDGKKGTMKWEYKASGEINSAPAIGPDGNVYVGCDDRKLYVLNGMTGKKLWDYETGGRVRVPPAVSEDGTVYLVSEDKNLYALKPDVTVNTSGDHVSLTFSPNQSEEIPQGSPIIISDEYSINIDGVRLGKKSDRAGS